MSDENKINYVSHSRLETYKQCPTKYNLKYNQGIPENIGFVDYFELGSLVHTVLEQHLDPNTNVSIQDALLLSLPAWLSNNQLAFNPKDIYNIGTLMGKLFYRASERCTGEKAIRNANGSVPNNVKSTPPKSWDYAMREAGMYEFKKQYDDLAAMQNPAFVNTSLTYFIGEVFFFTEYFKLPEWYGHTLNVEMPISTELDNLVLFPEENDLYIRAFIDWVFKTTDSLVVIADHKTSKSKPSPNSVLHNPQLNLYAYVYNMLMGYYPDVIAIHHVRSGEFIMAEVDKVIVEKILTVLRSTVSSLQTNQFITHHPDEFNTPCLRRDWKSKKVSEKCAYLETCWPTYVEGMDLELDLILD
jgi:hypothetical protein